MPVRKKCNSCGNICNSRSDIPLCITCSRKKRKSKIQRKEYARNWNLYKKYKLTPIEFDTIWIAFRGECGICNTKLILPESGRGQPRNAACIDHDHVTGNIRGLLCNSCNKAIGLLNDNPNLCKSAVIYLGGNYGN